ncbi:ABC1 kinase family protein [Actinocorallia longicatena]|uniref:AarF/ABC1/UbiB kinase family protein n=1 Tax=Actinocorallia longicatena TaxID=111803 RepID=A0ABP6QLF7_9ACTN
MTFRGPYADGPSPEDLLVDSPPLRGLKPRDVGRLIVIATVMGVSIGTAILRVRDKKATAVWGGVVTGFERLGPTFVKLGQLIASSPGIFPKPLADAALRCLDEVPPIDPAAAVAVIREDLGDPGEIFKSFDETPLSAASIGQVHACVLLDGREAVVKIQRPGIRDRMARDLRLAHLLSRFAERISKAARLTKPTAIIEDLHAVTFQELNSALEAHRQHQFRENLHKFGDNRQVTAPEIYWDHCGPRVICMERMYGTPFDESDTLRERGMDGPDMLRHGVKAWAEACLIHGLFHGDVHAGNLWVLDDGRTCYLDFGIMGEITPEWQQLLRDFFYTAMFDLDFTRIVRGYRRLGIIPEHVGTEAEIAMRMNLIFGPLLRTGLKNVSLGKTIVMLFDMAKQFEAETPRELVLVSKQLIYFERYSKALAPDWVLFTDRKLVTNIFPGAEDAA